MKLIIIGAGEVGTNIASRLTMENKEVVIIDKDPAALQRISDSMDVQTILGSGGNPAILEDADIKSADILVAVTDSDEANLTACLMTHLLAPATKKLLRLRDTGYEPYHDILHEKSPFIDAVINPEIEVAKTVDRLVRLPGVSDLGELAGGRMVFVGVRIAEDLPVVDIPLHELHTRVDSCLPLIAAIVRQNKLTIPRGGDTLQVGDLVYFISRKEEFDKALSIFHQKETSVHQILIVGGGRIGFRLAKSLEKESVQVKLVEKNLNRAMDLSEMLEKTIVLQGDGTDQSLLAEENIREMDAMVTLTDDEESNILASLLAKQMGVPKTVTRIDKFSYLPLVQTIGLEQVVSPRLSAVNSILQYIRQGKILSSTMIKGEQAEILEAVALETSDIVDIPLKKLLFPKDAILAGIIRKDDTIEVPNGDTIIHPNDRVIVFAKSNAISKVEKFLSVKLEFF